MAEDSKHIVCYTKWPGSSQDADMAGYDGPGWYFWDETDAFCHGPFNTKETAASAMATYCETALAEK